MSLNNLAIENEHDDIAKMLIKNGANVNAKNSYNDTPLHVAAENGYDDIVNLLIENGANVNAKNNDNMTPLDVADNKKIAESLHQVGGKHGNGTSYDDDDGIKRSGSDRAFTPSFRRIIRFESLTMR